MPIFIDRVLTGLVRRASGDANGVHKICITSIAVE